MPGERSDGEAGRDADGQDPPNRGGAQPADTIDYQVTVDDPALYTAPWTAAVPMTTRQGLLFEYACHEGNYGLAGILGGHRAEEIAAEAAKGK